MPFKFVEYLKTKKGNLSLIVFFTLLTSFLIYLNISDKSIIAKYWDGPNYIEVAKTLYNIPQNHPFTPYGTTPAYFACHLPMYPLFIRLFAFMSYPVSMIFVTLLFSVLATISFYYLLIEYKCVQSPLFSALISTFLPIRWLIYHSVGSTEPMFLFFVFSSLLAYRKNKIVLAMILASLSSVTRIVGILLIAVYFIEFIRTKRYKQLPLIAIIGIPLFLTFLFYQYQFGDFFAYFSWNSKLINPHILSIYNTYASNGDLSHSAELYFAFYVIYGLGVLLLWRYPTLFIYSLIFYIFNLFVFHEDLSRYFLTITHFTFIVAYDKILNTPQFKIISIFVFYLALVYATYRIPTNLVVEPVYQNLMNQLSYPF